MGKRADAWMPLYIADYMRDTMRLTRDQHGGYLLLLMECWNGGGRLPNDPAVLAAIVKASPAEWKTLSKVLIPYFKTQGKWLVHKRVSEERAKAQKLLDSKRENGRKGGRPRKPTESEAKPIGLAKRNLDHKLDETPARVEVPTAEPYPNPSQDRASTDSGDLGSDGKIVALAGRGSA